MNIQFLFMNSDVHVATTKKKKQFPFFNVFHIPRVFIKEACFEPRMF